MKFRLNRESVLRKLMLLSVVIAVPALGWGQHNSKPSAPKSSPPPKQSAPKPSAPSHSSQPSGQHNTTGGGQHGSNTGGQHGSTGMGQHGSTNTSGPHGTMNGQHGTTGNGQHGTTTNGQHGTNAGGQHGTTNNANQHGGVQHGQGAANGNNRGNTNNAKGTMNAKGGANGNRGAHTPPGKQVSLKGGGSAHIRPNGQIRSVNRNGMHIEHGVRGGRRVVATRNGVRVAAYGRRGGYVQRAYVVRGGHSYYSRTYYYHGAYRTGVYRGYYYGGRPYYGYYPAYYYQPVYYGWAYNPWPAPVAYGWGWGGAPWYGYYGAYYEPYPVYPSAAFWLTDFLVAASLQAAYEAQENAILYPNAADGTLVASLMPIAAAGTKDGPKLSPEVKNALAEEVKAQLAAEQSEAGKAKSSSANSGGQPAESKEAPPALDPKFKTFVVNDDLSLTPEDGKECALAEGDVIERTSDTADNDGNVSVKVVAANKADCAIGTEDSVAVDDLQEMYNHFREQMKDGMGELAKKNGTGGLPKAPDTTTTAGDVPAPPPDKTVEKTLQDTQSAADQTENEVKQEAGSGGGQ